MRPRRSTLPVAGAGCLAWLALSIAPGLAPGLAAAPSASVDLGGTAVPGGASTNPAEPTTLTAGLWSATVSAQYPQHFTYARRVKDSVVHVGVLGAPQSTDSDALSVKVGVRTPESTSLTSCGSASDTSEYVVPHAVLGARVAAGAGDGSSAESCRGSDELQIEVGRGSTSNPAEMPYVIKIVEEAPLTDPGGTEPDEEPSYDVPEPRAATERPGAASLAKAPKLDARSGPVTVTTTLTEGTEQLWRVPLTWGDLPVVRVDVPAATGADAETFSYSGPDLSVHLIDPMRGRFRHVDTEREHSATGQYVADEEGEGQQLVAAGYPVRPANGLLPGDYWVSVALEAAPEDRDPVDVTVELTAQVVAGGADEPSYQQAVLSQEQDAVPDGYSSAKPFLVGEETFAAVASGNPVVVVDEAEDWLSARRGAGLGVAALSVACLAGGLVRLRRA
ncbi:hypothetical protein JK386_02430 [Nocardioides sp. zg-536]|uniref:Uncharacterized protein n=1 Tax=Nocardioides faecalis TaxID=2803858 RepID=A0A938Y6F9_9ACTN|nr:hypothetical protein [Nocardioides faecalis]MBM9458745.1 hypothetical protein [Nocardioides faecalis]QVI58729.1 hypothetical protein KG111_17525 [Nocardioides faecalis]